MLSLKLSRVDKSRQSLTLNPNPNSMSHDETVTEILAQLGSDLKAIGKVMNQIPLTVPIEVKIQSQIELVHKHDTLIIGTNQIRCNMLIIGNLS
jgi:hypothetical protein